MNHGEKIIDGILVKYICRPCPECQAKLQAGEEMAKEIQRSHAPVCAFCGAFFPDNHTEAWPVPKCSCLMAGCRLPIVFIAWEKAGKGEE